MIHPGTFHPFPMCPWGMEWTADSAATGYWVTSGQAEPTPQEEGRPQPSERVAFYLSRGIAKCRPPVCKVRTFGKALELGVGH